MNTDPFMVFAGLVVLTAGLVTAARAATRRHGRRRL